MTLGLGVATGSLIESQLWSLGLPWNQWDGVTGPQGEGAGVSRKTEASWPLPLLPPTPFLGSWCKEAISELCVGSWCRGRWFRILTRHFPRGTHVHIPSGRTVSPLRPRVQPRQLQTDRPEPTEATLERTFPTSQTAAVTVKPKYNAVCQALFWTLDLDSKQQPCEIILSSPLFRWGNRGTEGLYNLAKGHS